jgi:hypothetical protein
MRFPRTRVAENRKRRRKSTSGDILSEFLAGFKSF